MRVVSAPPSSTRRASETISLSDIARTVPSGNSTAEWTQAEIRSLRGSARRASMTAIVASANSRTACTVRSAVWRSDPSGLYWPPSYIVTSDHSRHLGHRSRSKPSISAMTRAGSGAASACTTSHSPAPTTASMSSVTMPRTWSSCSFTERGVNFRATSRRLFWWSGSSLLIIDTSPTIRGREPCADE